MGRLGFGFGSLTRNIVGVGMSVAPPPPPPTGQTPLAIDETGWRAAVAQPQDMAFTPLAFDRLGFDGGGQQVVWRQDAALTKRVRQPYPDHADFTDNQVALSDYVYATDDLPDVANNSAILSPKPIAAWVMPSRELVANSVTWELVAYHRDAWPDPVSGKGRQVACVRVRASNGSQNTAWQAESHTVLSNLCSEGCPLEVYSGSLDITALGQGMFWLEAEVMPWLGGAASILRSEDNANPREFARRYFLKNTARAASPPLAYVSSTGSNTGGAVSTDPDVAAASPCLTVSGALARARAQLGAAQGSLDGLRIRILDRVSMGSVPYQPYYPQDIAAVIVERAPSVSREAAVVEWADTFRPSFRNHTAPITQGALTFRDITLDRRAGVSMAGEAASRLLVQFHNVAVLNNGNLGSWRASSDLAIFGMAIQGYSRNLTFTSAGEIRMLRGLVGDMAGDGPEAWITVACKLHGAATGGYADPAKGAIFASNEYRAPSATSGPLFFSGNLAGQQIGPLAVVQNLIEVTHTSASSASARIGAGEGLGDITHAVILHNTVTGTGALGRWNLAYDEHSSVARHHRLIAFKGNVLPQLNTKSDIFAQDGMRTGNFAFVHGTGCVGNYVVDSANAPESEHQSYAGPGSAIGAGPPAYVAYRGTSGNASSPIAGEGGGDYRLDPASAARGIVPGPLLGFDLAGQARGTGAQAAGAYA